MKTITLDKISPDSYFGVLYSGAGLKKSRAFLTRERFQDGLFLWSCCSGVSHGNHVANKKTTVQDAIKDALNSGFEVFEFPSHAALFKWLARD